MKGAVGMADKEYEIKEAARTLMHAEEIKHDKKMMPMVKKEMQKQMKLRLSAMFNYRNIV